MADPRFYTSDAAYERQYQAAREARDRADARRKNKTEPQCGVVIDVEFQEVDVSAAGDVRLIESNQSKGEK